MRTVLDHEYIQYDQKCSKIFFHFQGPPEEEHPDSATASEGEDEEEEEKGAKPEVAPPFPPSQPLLIGSCSGFIETTVKIKQNDMLPGPKVRIALSCSVYQG